MTEFGAAAAHDFATSIGRASPQNRLKRRPGYIPGLSMPSFFMNTAIEGTENQTVSFASTMKAPGLISALYVGQQRHAPFSQVTNISCTERSKVMSNV